MAALCVLLTAACCCDYRYKKIPNYLIALMAALGAGWRFLGEGAPGTAFYAGEAILVMSMLYPLFKIGAVGAGDVKLLGVTAGYLPCKKILVFLMLSLLVSAAISLFKMLRKRYFFERMKYFLNYLKNVAKNGSWRLYLSDEQDRRAVGICLSGPVFVSVLLYIGGVY